MADFHEYHSLALDDDQLYDMAKLRDGAGGDLPDYPPGMQFTIREADYEALGIENCHPGETVKFAAMCRVTSCSHRTDGCRVELEMDMLKLGDGEFAELGEMTRPTICLDENDHERLDLDEECSQGDLLHLIGEARVVATDDNRYVGESVTLQAEQATIENESTEGTEPEDEDDE